MRSKTLLLVTSVVLLGFCSESFGLLITNWTGGGGDDLWNTAGNWNNTMTQFADARIKNMLVTDPAALIDATHVGVDAADPNKLFVGHGGSLGVLRMTGGILDVGSNGNLRVGNGNNSDGEFYLEGGTASFAGNAYISNNSGATGLLDISGGTMTVAKTTRIGHKGVATLNMSGGSLTVSAVIQVGREGGTGTINISGGLLKTSGGKNMKVGQTNNSAAGTGVINMTGGEIVLSSGDLQVGLGSSTGNVWLDGGEIRPANVEIHDDGVSFITIDQGVLIVGGDDTNTLQGYANNDMIREKTTLSGRAIRVEYDAGTNKTTVSADVTLLYDAWGENPSNNGSIELDPTVAASLSWSAGDFAIAHEVYVGSSFADVNDATNASPVGVVYQGQQGGTSFGASGLGFGDTVYWRIDEVNSGGGAPPLTKGKVWSFSVLNTITVEDYDGYADTTALKAAWAENGTAITLENEFYGNSMGMRYNAASGAGDSEASLTFGAGQNWTTGGAVSLTLTFKGEPNNVAAGMYLTVEDGSAGSGTSAYAGAGGDLVQEDWEGWQVWDVDLADFGVDLTDVTKLTIGINSGSEASPSQDYGYVSFDDIVLYPPRCKPEYVATSFNYDCTTDEDDLEVINDAWLERAYNVVAVTPNSGGLQAHYLFDETSGTNAADDSSNSNDATVDAAGAGAWDVAGGRGGSGCLAFDGTFGVSLPSAVFASISDAVTISVWVKDDAAVNPESVGRAEFGAGPRDPNEWWDRVTWIQDSPEDYVGQWNHYCFVKDVSTGMMWMYHNGVMVSRDKRAVQPIGVGGWGSSKIGASTDGDSGYYVGRMDDFQIYDYALNHAEVVSLAGLSDVDQPLQPVLSPVDPIPDGIINLFDVGLLGESWMLEQLWP